MMRPRSYLQTIFCLMTVAVLASSAFAQAPPSLLVLSKNDHTVSIVDPASLQVLARLPAPAPIHTKSPPPTTANSPTFQTTADSTALSTPSLSSIWWPWKALPPIDLGAIRSTHGLAFASGKLYFTAETNKIIGRYDPATQHVDWILGTGQDRTHMVEVSKSLDKIFTSNVNSATISIIEQVSPPAGGFGPPPGALPGSGPPAGAPPQGSGAPAGPRLTWEISNVPAGKGVEGFDISPDGKEIWAANARDATVTIIDVAAKKAIQTLPIAVKGANRLKFTPDGKRVLISGLGARAGDSSLVVMDATTRKEVKQLTLGGGAAGILIAPDGARAYVAVSMADKVAVIDLKTLEVRGQIDAGKQPDGLAWVGQK